MEIVTRPATVTDVNFLARLMERSMLPVQGQGLFDELSDAIGMDRISFHEALLLSGASNWGQLDDYIVAECDGEPAAGTSAHISTMPDIRPMTTAQVQALSQHLELSPERSRNLLRAAITKFGAFGDLPHLRHPAEYVLEYGAVMPEFEGLRLPGYVIGHHVKRAKEQGRKTLGIIVVDGNALALSSFSRYGLHHHSTVKADHVGGGYLGSHRLVLDLDDLPEGYALGGPLVPIRRRRQSATDAGA